MSRFLIAAAAAVSLAGCTLEPAYVRPTSSVPSAWPVGPAYPPASGEALPSLSYRDTFKDPHLQSVIEQALARNQDLRAAMANVEVARAQYGAQRAAQFPQLNANGTASVAQSEPATTAAGAGSNGAGMGRVTTRAYQADLSISAFELDLFGRLRSLSHAAQQQYLASEAGARAARLTLIAEVANAYLVLAADNSLLTIARQTETSAGRTVQLTTARLEGGVAPRTDLTQAQTVLEQARSDNAQLTTNLAQDRNLLELLVGDTVPDADIPASIEGVDGLLAEAPAGLDSRILLRRPDVVEAEYGLRAANARIGAARAAFFPTISLTTLAGFASPQLSSLFNGRNFAWQAQGAATQSIFDGGANISNLRLAKAQRDVAVAQYQKAIQTAFREVADALARRGTMSRQLDAQTALERAAAQNFTLSEARYRQGIDPYLNTLDAQRTLYAARQTLASARLTRAQNLVALYQGLAGDQ